MVARFRISVGNRRDLPVAKNRSVSALANERIIDAYYKQYVYDGQGGAWQNTTQLRCPYSALIPASRTGFAHFAISDFRKTPNS
ncbi:MAG: hypothetical protein NTW47_16530 [Proteobacteria bacterium]|nr:hypothetical protein [Pseudomonadota bacterium]